jgi:uncharacterized protein YcbX
MADETVLALWRYPVKSLRGEQIEATEVGIDGVFGDRLVYDCAPSGRVVTSRYRPGLLGLSATLADDGEPLIDGHVRSEEVSLARVRAASALMSILFPSKRRTSASATTFYRYRSSPMAWLMR